MFMKPIRIIFFVTAVLFLWACVPKMAPVRLDPADALFSRAEKMLQAESYPEALDAYGEYLERFPDRPLADAALMKLGSVYAILGDNEKARNAYERLIAEYPESIFVPDARIEILTTYYNQGYYEDVITQAADLIEVLVSGGHFLESMCCWATPIWPLALQRMPFIIIYWPSVKLESRKRKPFS